MSMFFYKRLMGIFLSIVFFNASAIPNPASANCIKVGGKLEIQKRGDGGQYGICLFEDNRQCEEWALFRDECPVGGVKITGYTSSEQIYCVIQGGKLKFVDKFDSHAQCVFPNGVSCNVQAFFDGKCEKQCGC